jgi:hypothetical protein
MKTTCQTLLLPLLLLLAACSGGELVGVHIDLREPGAYTVTTRSLVDPNQPGPAEARTRGVQWQARAALVCSQGRFQDLSDVELGAGSVRFAASIGDPQPHLRVFLKRGPDADWVKLLLPEETVRQGMANIYDPTGKTREIGDAIRFEIHAPGDIVTSGVHPTGRGVEASSERRRAYLIVPLRTALEKGEELVWDLSWRVPEGKR